MCNKSNLKLLPITNIILGELPTYKLHEVKKSPPSELKAQATRSKHAKFGYEITSFLCNASELDQSKSPHFVNRIIDKHLLHGTMRITSMYIILIVYYSIPN